MEKWILLFLCLAGGLWARNIRVTWDPNQEPDVIGYRIWLGTNSHAYQTNWWVEGRTNCTLVISNIPPATWFLSATAHTTNLASDFCEELSFVIPRAATGLGVTNDTGVAIFGQLEAAPDPAGPYHVVQLYPGYVSQEADEFFRVNLQIFNLP